MVRVGNVVVMAPIVTSQSTCRCTLPSYAGTDLVRRMEARQGRARQGKAGVSGAVRFRSDIHDTDNPTLACALCGV